MSEDRSTTTTSVVLTIVVTSIAFALIQLDVTIVNVALPRIGSDLSAPVSALQWVVDAYALTFAVLLLSAGRLGDRLGAKRVYIGGLMVFAGGSLACGLAPVQGVLIAARVAQGIGAAAMMPSSLSLLNAATAHDDALRTRAIGWWTAAGSVAIAAGPIVGGLLIGLFGWRSIFIVNLPICALGLLLTRSLPWARRRPPEGRGFDPAGQALAVIALTGLIGGLIELRQLGATHPLALAGFLAFAVCSALFVMVERRTPAPMLPPRFFGNRDFVMATLFGIVVNLTYYGIIFVLSLYLQRVRGFSAMTAGVAFLPLTAMLFASNVLSGWAVGWLGTHGTMIVGALLDAAGFGLLLILGRDSFYWVMLPAFVLVPAGMGLGVPAMTTAVLASVEDAEAGVASGALNAARQGAGAIGVAIFGALAGEEPASVVGGLHTSALVAIALLAAIAATVGVGARAKSRATD